MMNAVQLHQSTQDQSDGYPPAKVDKRDQEVRTVSTEFPPVEDILRSDDGDSDDESEDGECQCELEHDLDVTCDVARNSERSLSGRDDNDSQPEDEEAQANDDDETLSVPDREQDFYQRRDGNVDADDAPLWTSVSNDAPYFPQIMMPRPPDSSAPRGPPVGRRYVAPTSSYSVEADATLAMVEPHVNEADNADLTPNRDREPCAYSDGNVDGVPEWTSVSDEAPYTPEIVVPRPPGNPAAYGPPVGRRYVASNPAQNNVEADVTHGAAEPIITEAHNGNASPDRDQEPCFYADGNVDGAPVWTSVSNEAPYTPEVHVPRPPGAPDTHGPSRGRWYSMPSQIQEGGAADAEAAAAELENEPLVAQGAAAWWMRSRPDSGGNSRSSSSR